MSNPEQRRIYAALKEEHSQLLVAQIPHWMLRLADTILTIERNLEDESPDQNHVLALAGLIFETFRINRENENEKKIKHELAILAAELQGGNT